MSIHCATAVAHPNIAFIKYWGNRENTLRLPSNGSISMNLAGLFTRTTVQFDPSLESDQVILNGTTPPYPTIQRITSFLDIVREMAGKQTPARVVSENNFPTGAGIASSASAFAALGLAASQAAGLKVTEPQLSALARRGSGSACRSIPGGFTEWLTGSGDRDSFAVTIASADHWKLYDCIAILEVDHKPVGSTQGHSLAATSILQSARVADAPRRLDICRHAILTKNFENLAEIAEQDSNLMHAVMMTSSPPLFYWAPTSLNIIKNVPTWRKENLPVFYTLDAGSNVHLICPEPYQDQVIKRLMDIPNVQNVLIAPPGGPASLAQG